jgi:hypothetical protein
MSDVSVRNYSTNLTPTKRSSRHRTWHWRCICCVSINANRSGSACGSATAMRAPPSEMSQSMHRIRGVSSSIRSHAAYRTRRRGSRRRSVMRLSMFTTAGTCRTVKSVDHKEDLRTEIGPQVSQQRTRPSPGFCTQKSAAALRGERAAAREPGLGTGRGDVTGSRSSFDSA